MATRTGDVLSWADDESPALGGLLEAGLPLQAVALDEAGRVLTATPLLRQAARARGVEDVIGRSWREVFPRALVRGAEMERRIARAVESGHQVVLPRVDVTEAGAPSSFLVTLVPLDHPVARVAVYVQDVTDLVSSAARERDADALEALGGLASTLAHEIRNPLAGMSGTLQVLLRGLPRDDPQRQVFHHVLSHIERLGAVAEALIALSRPLHPAVVGVDLREISARAADRPSREEHLGPTEIVGEGTARADPDLLERAVEHLVRNAWQSGAARVRIRVADGSILVEDDGPGVAEIDRARVFQPFYTTRLHGLGLGLPEARRSVESMRGTLEWTRSSLGGAALEITLP